MLADQNVPEGMVHAHRLAGVPLDAMKNMNDPGSAELPLEFSSDCVQSVFPVALLSVMVPLALCPSAPMYRQSASGGVKEVVSLTVWFVPTLLAPVPLAGAGSGPVNSRTAMNMS